MQILLAAVERKHLCVIIVLDGLNKKKLSKVNTSLLFGEKNHCLQCFVP